MTTVGEHRTADALNRYTDALTERVSAESGIEYAYRDVGQGDVPLVALQCFRGNLENWADAARRADLVAAARNEAGKLGGGA